MIQGISNILTSFKAKNGLLNTYQFILREMFRKRLRVTSQRTLQQKTKETN